MTACSRCNTQQLPNTLFCDTCGEATSDLLAAEPDGGHRTSLWLDLLDRGHSLPLHQPIEAVIGRADGQTANPPEMNLDDYGGQAGGVSRRHARLFHRGPELYLEDLGSLNGTFINERRLPPNQPTVIRPGDLIRLGLLRLSLRERLDP